MSDTRKIRMMKMAPLSRVILEPILEEGWGYTLEGKLVDRTQTHVHIMADSEMLICLTTCFLTAGLSPGKPLTHRI